MARGGRGIPREARAFVTEHVHSITQLELLLLLHDHPDQPWTAADASRALRAPERLLAGQLADFYAAGVLTAGPSDAPEYRFSTTGRHARAVDELAACVRQRKRAVHDLILRGPSSDVQVFSDAFRLRRDDDD
jgi:hypothetical protein